MNAAVSWRGWGLLIALAAGPLAAQETAGEDAASALDWHADLRLRGEQTFAGIAALVAQINADVAAARRWLAEYQ